jgi:hypothetical protein
LIKKKKKVKIRSHLRRTNSGPVFVKKHIRNIPKKSRVKRKLSAPDPDLFDSKIQERIRRKYYNKSIPISICSFKKVEIKHDYPANLYSCNRLIGFRRRFPDHIVLSRKNGLMFSIFQYFQYSNDEELTDEQLIEKLRQQRELFPWLELHYYNPRPLTGTKWIRILEEAGFKVKEFRKLDDFQQKSIRRIDDFIR